ncbi:hypothetical protein Q8A67_014610 [Cirrhinus molitorella]|uniref:Uncharacterized protein n=1 Tax=Cirrhinus molitorella TaxID=172907 RepID=A0AA88PQW5_9TELE|nr:hypothetical protein Q8A67_014610 [Cirrhinus molitorella]
MQRVAEQRGLFPEPDGQQGVKRGLCVQRIGGFVHHDGIKRELHAGSSDRKDWGLNRAHPIISLGDESDTETDIIQRGKQRGFRDPNLQSPPHIAQNAQQLTL